MKNGITLIALIITIIVMLILVGVTINFAINGGIINKAKTASQDMQRAADKEELQMAVISSMDYLTEKVNRNDLVSSLGSNWQVSSTAPYTCTSPAGNVFTVSEDGIITEEGTSNNQEPAVVEDEDLEYLRTLFLGAKDPNTGERPKNIPIFSLSDDFNNFTDSNIKGGGSDDFVEESATIVSYVRYKQKGYKIIIDLSSGDFSTISAIDVLRVGANLPAKVGKYVRFNGDNDLWVVLYDENEKTTGAQLVSANGYLENQVYLGKQDSIIDWTDSQVLSEADIFNDKNNSIITDQSQQNELTNIEKAIYSYNHLVENLNYKCSELIGTKTGVSDVRCIGSDPINKNQRNTTKFTNQDLQMWPENFYPAGTFDSVLYDEDDNYLQDIERLRNMAYLSTDNSVEYWFASKSIGFLDGDGMDYWYFAGRRDGSIEDQSGSNIFIVGDYNAAENGWHSGLRPVIILDDGLLSSASGTGTIDDPYIIQ